MTPEQQHLLEQLQQFLSDQTHESVRIVGAKPLAGGASRDSWHISAQIGDMVHQYVLRRDLPSQMFEESLTREQEFRLMSVAFQNGVKVAQVRYLCMDSAVLGSPFFIMDYVGGISIGRKVMTEPSLATAREVLPFDMAEQLARIHAINPHVEGLDFLARPIGKTASEASVEQCYSILDSLNVHNPVWEWTLRWASNHMPTANRETFIHGDFRIGNLLVDEKGLSAVIDWEFAHIGDPDEELGYLCMRDWRFGNTSKRAGGLIDRETFLRAYESASGRQVDRVSVDWWELIGNIRWGVICMAQANRHLSGQEHSVELASLGRRSAEMQLESLRLIESYG